MATNQTTTNNISELNKFEVNGQTGQNILLDELGYSTRESALEYVNKRKSDWGDNLIGWVEEREGKWFPCFNVWD